MRRYLKPRDNGYLMEAAACSKLLKELRRIEAKFVRAVEKETAIRQSEFETVMRYSSEQEILDDYGWGFLTEAQYDRYRELYEKGRAALEDLPPTQNKLTLQLVRRIIADLDAERREWEVVGVGGKLNCHKCGSWLAVPHEAYPILVCSSDYVGSTLCR